MFKTFKEYTLVASLASLVFCMGCQSKDSDLHEHSHSGSSSCACCAHSNQKVTSLPVETLIELPVDKVNMPDGICLLDDDSILVSVTNFEDEYLAPMIGRVTTENKFETFYELPTHPETGRVGPMGIGQASNGDIYLADTQYFFGEEKEGEEKAEPLLEKSRLLRVVMKDGKPVETKVVAEGMNFANAVAFKDGEVYLSDTILEPGTKPLITGVFRFKLDDENVKLTKPFREDPHFLKGSEIKTKNVKSGFGADGLAFDKAGNLYIGNFSDGIVHKLTFDKDGEVASNTVFASDRQMKSVDGLFYNEADNKLYVADMLANAVHAIAVADGTVETLAICEDDDVKDLESPCEAIVRGNKVIISNTDLVIGKNTKRELPSTLAVIQLPKKDGDAGHDHDGHDHDDHGHDHGDGHSHDDDHSHKTEDEHDKDHEH